MENFNLESESEEEMNYENENDAEEEEEIDETDDDGEEDDGEEDDVPKKNARERFKYRVIAAFDTAEALEKFLTEDFDTTSFYRERTRKQKKHMIEVYHCKHYRQGCRYAVVVRLTLPTATNPETKSVVEERLVEHKHTNAKSTSLTEEVKEFIMQHLDKTAIVILRLLKKEKMNTTDLSKKQVENFHNRERKKNGTRGELTEYELEEEARKYPRNDQEPDKPYATYTGLSEYRTVWSEHRSSR
uniref:Transposase n=1 Tax=Panagrolaimus sp. JU765 TaxID=591449 RepID=A0AC34RG46_9BILA